MEYSCRLLVGGDLRLEVCVLRMAGSTFTVDRLKLEEGFTGSLKGDLGLAVNLPEMSEAVDPGRSRRVHRPSDPWSTPRP